MNTDKELDELLNSYRVDSASTALQQRIKKRVRKPSPWSELLELLGGWKIAAPALAFSVLCGVSSQLWWMQNTPNNEQNDSVWTLALLDSTQDWSDE